MEEPKERIQKKTIDEIKKKRIVSEQVKENRKDFQRIKKLLLSRLESEAKTIPQLAKDTNLPAPLVTFHVMTLRKFGEIQTGEIDDMDEYYYYEIKK